jgi:hypothetical protein
MKPASFCKYILSHSTSRINHPLVPAISIFLLLTTAKFSILRRETPISPKATIDVHLLSNTLTNRDDLSQAISLEITEPSDLLDLSLTTGPKKPKRPKKGKKPKKPKEPKPPKEPETCSSQEDCFFNHRCTDGICVVGCESDENCNLENFCYNGFCHWKAFPNLGRPRKCQANKQYCMRDYHCCYNRCGLPLNLSKGIFGKCVPVPRGEDSDDEWGDMQPGSEDIDGFSDGLERRVGMGRRNLVAEAREFDLESEELGLELIEKGAAAN